MMLFTTVKADAIILYSLFFILRCLLPHYFCKGRTVAVGKR